MRACVDERAATRPGRAVRSLPRQAPGGASVPKCPRIAPGLQNKSLHCCGAATIASVTDNGSLFVTFIISLVNGGAGGDGTERANETLAAGDGGARGTRVHAVECVHVQGPAHEALRLRLTFHRAVVSGSYLTVVGHRAPGSVGEREVVLRWDATVASPALKRFRQRVRARRAERGKVGQKRYAVREAARALYGARAPVNRYTVAAMLDLEGLRVTPFYIRDQLGRAGWRRLREYEYPHDAPGYGISNWVPGSI